jgi:hypothetical protein
MGELSDVCLLMMMMMMMTMMMTPSQNGMEIHWGSK